jgi:hypothetical protein
MSIDAMKTAAIRLGWRLTPTEPSVFETHSILSIFGHDDGVPVRLDRDPPTYTFTTTAFFEQAIPFDFMVTTESMGDKLRHIAGFHDVEIGDPDFDRVFKLETSSPERLKALLHEDMKSVLFALRDAADPSGRRGFRVTPLGISITRVYPPVLFTAQDAIADLPLAVSTVKKVNELFAHQAREAGKIPYR